MTLAATIAIGTPCSGIDLSSIRTPALHSESWSCAPRPIVWQYQLEETFDSRFHRHSCLVRPLDSSVALSVRELAVRSTPTLEGCSGVERRPVVRRSSTEPRGCRSGSRSDPAADELISQDLEIRGVSAIESSASDCLAPAQTQLKAAQRGSAQSQTAGDPSRKDDSCELPSPLESHARATCWPRQDSTRVSVVILEPFRRIESEEPT